ncbi:MAG: glycine zipper family protein [Nannocystaceae bacterium]|nr:glycine zipper family protein [Nannocystaceae bacterium]
MTEFFNAALSFPTVVFTVLLLVTVAYWTMVILGAMGVDVLEFDVDGAADGAAEGAAEGALEGAAHGAAEGAAEGAAHGVAEGAAHGSSHGLAGSLLAAFRVKGVPVTIVLSLVVFYGWIITHVTTLYVLQGASMDGGVLRGLLFVVGVVASFPLAALSARPLGRLVKEEVAATRQDLIGKIVRVDTSRVDQRFGSASYDDGAGGFIIQIRCDAEDNQLCRGSQALVMSWDDTREVYEVTPFDNLLAPSKTT